MSAADSSSVASRVYEAIQDRLDKSGHQPVVVTVSYEDWGRLLEEVLPVLAFAGKSVERNAKALRLQTPNGEVVVAPDSLVLRL